MTFCRPQLTEEQKMDTLTAGYQFSADAFRRFIIRTLTDDIPPDGDPRFYVSTSKSIIKALINMHSFEIQLSPIG
uniref:Uncharacterized protein n=4 Tax=Enterobacteriaceae TaxID=543 RepID=A0A890DKA6_ECOLX|nr:hypothetical protein [Escherichia coli]